MVLVFGWRLVGTLALSCRAMGETCGFTVRLSLRGRNVHMDNSYQYGITIATRLTDIKGKIGYYVSKMVLALPLKIVSSSGTYI